MKLRLFFEGTAPHFLELKRRFFWVFACFLICFCISFYYAEFIFRWLTEPLMLALSKHHLPQEIVYTRLTEAFSVYTKMAFFVGLFLVVPIIEWHLWKFLSPGLTAKEKHLCLMLLWGAPLLFFSGAAFCRLYLLERLFDFFVQFSDYSHGKQILFPMVTMDDFLGLTFKMIFCSGVCLQLPLVMVLLSRIGITNSHIFRSNRRFIIVGIFALSAVITPPDVLSQFIVALPLWGLYELAIVFMRIEEKKRDHA